MADVHTGNSSFSRSLAIQARVMHALLMREVITRYGRENLGVLWLFVEPMLFTVGVAALWTTAGMNHGSSLPIVGFAVTGYSSVLLWRNCALRSSMAIGQNLSLLFHRNVRVIDIFLTRIILEIAGATASFTILSTLFITFGWMAPPVDLLQVMYGWLMLAWLGAALALTIGAGTGYYEVVERLWHPVSYIFFPISGAAFMVDWLPTDLQKVVLLLPMVHGTEMLRDGFFGTAERTHYDVGYMAMFSLVLTWLGLYLVRGAGLRIESK